MDSKPKSTRFLWADILKIIAIYAVILIHTAAPLLITYYKHGVEVWWVGNIFDSIARWCIPIFFMLSGTFLIDKATQIGPFLKRRLTRVGIPFLIWSAIYFVWNIEINGNDTSYNSFFLSILRKPVYYHLWYLYILMGLYLCAPILNLFVLSAQKNHIIYVVTIWILFGSLIPTIVHYFGITFVMMCDTPFSLFSYLGFFLLGHLLRNVQCSLSRCLLWLLLLFLGLVATVLGTWWLTVHEGKGTFSNVFYEYYSPNVLITAISVFILVKNIRFPGQIKLPAILTASITFTAACVPGIYLVHPMIIELLKQHFAGFRFNQHSYGIIIGVPWFSLLVFGISLIIITIIRFIPGLKRIVP